MKRYQNLQTSMCPQQSAENPENGGEGGSKADWNFSKNSSILEDRAFYKCRPLRQNTYPKLGKLSFFYNSCVSNIVNYVSEALTVVIIPVFYALLSTLISQLKCKMSFIIELGHFWHLPHFAEITNKLNWTINNKLKWRSNIFLAKQTK